MNLGVAALAMVGTLPGRTQGLGLITEGLIADLRIDRVAFAQINLWATLAGAPGLRGCAATIVAKLGSTTPLAIGERLISTGNSVPSLRRPYNSRPMPIVRVWGWAK